MLKLKDLKKYNWTTIILMTVAAVVLVGIIIITAAAIINSRDDGQLSAQGYIASIAYTEDIPLKDDVIFITDAKKCYDSNGKLIAYEVTGYSEGFCARVSVRSYFDVDGKTLIGIRVTDQEESKNYGKLKSENYGADIVDSTYVQRFEYAKMPLWHYEGQTDETRDGTRIDVLTGATVSSAAVIDAVNASYTYLIQNVL